MIRLDERFVIEHDGCQYILQESYVVQSGKDAGSVKYKNAAYHHSLSSAIESYLRRCQADIVRSGIYSLAEACQKLEKEQKRCVNIIEKLEKLK